MTDCRLLWLFTLVLMCFGIFLSVPAGQEKLLKLKQMEQQRAEKTIPQGAYHTQRRNEMKNHVKDPTGEVIR